jgi:SAM-dependent methyltransferase
MSGLSETQVKQAVRRHYAELATKNESSCCGPSVNSALLDEDVPKESAASALSCGSPLAHANLKEGEVVLDLGSGCGIDVFRASKLAGSKGRVIGVDATPEMLFKARDLAEKHGYGNVEFRLGEIEHLPVDSGTVDLVISNCVINLVPDKRLAFKEIHRVLKPGGRIAISDMIATKKPEGEREIDPEEWAACIAGAVTLEEYAQTLRETGFREIRHLDENYSMESCCSTEFPVKSVTWLATKPPS